MKRFDEAIREIRRAEELDPLSLIIIAELGGVYADAGRLDEAVAECNRALAPAEIDRWGVAGDAIDGLATLALPEDEPPHPVRDLTQAARALAQPQVLERGDVPDADWGTISSLLRENQPVQAAAPPKSSMAATGATRAVK